MKRVLLLTMVILLLVLNAGCGRTTPEYDETSQVFFPEDSIAKYDTDAVVDSSPIDEPATEEPAPAEPPTLPLHEETVHVLPEVSLPFNTVASFLARTQEMFDRDDGALLGFPFHVPILVVDPVTRDAIANRADPAGYLTPFGDVFYGTLPEDVQVWAVGTLASEDFGGERWVVMSWQALQSHSAASRLAVVAHYAIHWHQGCVDFFGEWVAYDNSHMNEFEARVSIRLEMNALTAAFRATGDTRTARVADALAIRAERRRIFDRAGDENRFINHEGLAQFTEMALPAASPGALRTLVLDMMESMAFQVRDIGLERMFGYFVGAMYAFLLNETDTPWVQYINFHADLGYILKEALGIEAIPSIEEVDLTRFGYAAISREEREWADNRTQMINRLTEIFINQPTLIIYGNDLPGGFSLRMSGHVSNFAEFGMIIIGGTEFSGSFGTMNLRDGYFRRDVTDSDWFFMMPAQNLEIDGNRITAYSMYGNRRHSNWTMYLNEGYSLIEYGNGFRVVRSD